MIRKFKFRNASFTMTFDDEGVADVITRNGKVISAADQCGYEPIDGLLDRNGYETRKCCNCGALAEFFAGTYYGDCDGPSLLSNGRGGFSPEGQA